MAAGGRFEVRLTHDAADIAAAQALRYRVFYREMGARANATIEATGRDQDEFDPVCDHLLVFDHARAAGDTVVGTYRLLLQREAERFGRFYSAAEYDIQPLLDHVGEAKSLMELGRSCVHADYRTSTTIRLLWRGIARYIFDNGISHLFGCASLHGCDPDQHRDVLTYLHRHHMVPPHLHVRALPERYVAMDRLAGGEPDQRAVFRQMPPLIKAYLRLGCYIGDGAVIDADFNTIDVFILLPVERIDQKYYSLHDGQVE
ncbi:MAG: GNAT family N-acetyltransferase [Alphaproteobacteria bacterium]|nr:GNAT family N-acetyltransferase [Alphaproteobacteria bacterium]